MRAGILFSLISFISLSFPQAMAQPRTQGLPADGEENFYDIQRSFNAYWEGKDHTQKGKGWKQFKRWEWFWEQRVYPTGKLPDPMHLYNESRALADARGKSPEALGGSWTILGPSTSTGGYSGLGRINCVRTDPVNSSVLWAGAPAGGLWKSTDAGLSWSTSTDELPSIGVTDLVIDPSNPAIMYIATGDGDAGDTYSVGVMKSTDGGITWNTTGLNWATSLTRRISRLLMHPTNPGILLAAGSAIYKSTDGGVSWVNKSAGTFRDMEFKPGDPTVVYASTSNGQVRRSTDGGETWSLLSDGIPTTGGRVALAVTAGASDFVYALYSLPSSGQYGFSGLYRSTDNGNSWSFMSNTPNILGWAVDGSDVGGQGWYDLALAASPTRPDELYAGGVNTWKSADGGATWSILTMWYGGTGVPAVHADQHDLWFVPGTSTLYSGNDGGVYRTGDGGTTWTWLGNGLKTTQFYRLGLSATNAARVIAGAQDNGTKLMNATAWSDVIGGDGMECAIDYTNANIMYGTLYYGDLRRSANGGASFSPISSTITERGAWVTPFELHPTNPASLFAGYVNVWKTTNSGGTWSRISNFGTSSTLDILKIAPSNPQVLYVVDNTTIRRTTNGGTSWTTMTTPSGTGTLTDLAIHPTHPDSIWVTSSGYSASNKVYHSTTGGATWTNITGTLPNVPANTVVFERNSPDRVYVGTDIGVYYRDQNQSGWQDFNTGLPNVVISELEIHYGSGKLRAATYGRGIWESPLVPAPVPVCTVSSDSISVALAPGDSITQTITIGNTGNGPLTWSISGGAPWLTATPSAGTVPVSGSQPVTVRIKAASSSGTFLSGALQFFTNDPLANPAVVVVGVRVQWGPTTVSIPAAGTWNILSIPLVASDYSAEALLPGATSAAFLYSPGGGYQSRDTLDLAHGYWVKFPSDRLLAFAGTPLLPETIDVSTDWNLVGSASDRIPTTSIIALGTAFVSRFYSFGGAGYAATDTLSPGAGYWVKMSGPGRVVFPHVMPGSAHGERAVPGAATPRTSPGDNAP